MSAVAALLLAASGSPDLLLARDAFAGLCGDLSSEAAVAKAVAADGWAEVAPDPARGIGRYHAMAAAWKDWRGTVFRSYRKTIGGRTIDALVFDVRAEAEVGAGLHCDIWFDDAQVASTEGLTRWGGNEPTSERDRFLQWREPAVFATHDVTTVEIGPRGAVHIWSINGPETRK